VEKLDVVFPISPGRRKFHRQSNSAYLPRETTVKHLWFPAGIPVCFTTQSFGVELHVLSRSSTNTLLTMIFKGIIFLFAFATRLIVISGCLRRGARLSHPHLARPITSRQELRQTYVFPSPFLAIQLDHR
jgi:hypothetical protein